MKNIIQYCSIVILFCLSNYSFGQIGRLALSPLQTIEQKIAKTDIKIFYSRPAMRGRVIFGGLVPWDKMWRTGANRNTKISFSEDVVIDGKTLAKGEYAIFTKPNPESWEIYFYSNTDNWDVPEEWDDKEVAAHITVPSNSNARQLQSLTITLEDLDNHEFNLNIHWDKTFVVVPIQLTTSEMMNETIADVLSGPDADDYFLAAQYHLESETKLEEALAWINKSIAIREN